MNKNFFSELLLSLVAFLTLPCYSMQEEKIVSPSLYPLCENFRTANANFIVQAEEIINRLKNISGDDAAIELFTLQRNLQTINMLNYLIDCKIEDNSTSIKLKQNTNSCVKEICQYLKGVMPYAGQMQDVILSVLNEEFGVNSIEGLEAIVK